MARNPVNFVLFISLLQMFLYFLSGEKGGPRKRWIAVNLTHPLTLPYSFQTEKEMFGYRYTLKHINNYKPESYIQ